MKTNIPIYRAKKTDSDKYVIGYLLPEYKGKFYLSIEWSRDFDGDTPDFVQIDISTLSIHFSNMLDSQGNKIFASLQEDGKGGDICQTIDYLNGTLNGVAIYDNFSFRIHRIGKAMGISFTSKDIKIIGIKE